MLRSSRSPLFLLFAGAFVAACSAGNSSSGTTDNNNDGGSGAGGRDNTGGDNTGASVAEGGSDNNGGSMGPGFSGGGDQGGGEEGGGPPINPCGTGCGPTELCDGINKGLDDNCDGTVDEGCPCTAGQISSCFKGDPSFASFPGCFPGSMKCSEQGDWGFCQGGTHAVSPDNCQEGEAVGCHPISAVPFQTVDLSEGAGIFDDNGTNHTYTVACPADVSPCPMPSGTSFQPLQSGEYTVTFTKTVNAQQETCSFPLYVGAKGLRVELSWNYQSGSTIDLDLHMHQPNNTLPWNYSGSVQDCGFANCKVGAYSSATSPNWFSDTAVPPDPVNWYESPNPEENTCYYAPRGVGQTWQNMDRGCHSPRLDLDNISCTPSITDPNSGSFCAPENINVDFPPQNEWHRIGVHYYPGTSTYNGIVTPTVKIFCDGALAAVLGPQDSLTYATLNSASDEDKMWMVADVLFRDDGCVKECVVEPLHAAGTSNPILQTKSTYTSQFLPAYPPIPMP